MEILGLEFPEVAISTAEKDRAAEFTQSNNPEISRRNIAVLEASKLPPFPGCKIVTTMFTHTRPPTKSKVIFSKAAIFSYGIMPDVIEFLRSQSDAVLNEDTINYYAVLILDTSIDTEKYARIQSLADKIDIERAFPDERPLSYVKESRGWSISAFVKLRDRRLSNVKFSIDSLGIVQPQTVSWAFSDLISSTLAPSMR